MPVNQDVLPRRYRGLSRLHFQVRTCYLRTVPLSFDTTARCVANVTVHATKAQMESRGTAPRSRNFGAKRGGGAIFQRADLSALTLGTNSGIH